MLKPITMLIQSKYLSNAQIYKAELSQTVVNQQHHVQLY